MVPNRSQRRKLAKDLGLLGKDVSQKQKEEQSQRAKEMGKMIHLRNLTEQRNRNKK
jgi:hypothetical protein